MEVVAKFEPNLTTEKKLKKIPEDVLYKMAKITLDMSIPIIPMSDLPYHSGILRRTTASSGVHECAGGYFIGSYTTYASHVWNLNDDTTNWTTPNTHSQWFARTLKEKGKVILENAINQAWKDEF